MGSVVVTGGGEGRGGAWRTPDAMRLIRTDTMQEPPMKSGNDRAAESLAVTQSPSSEVLAVPSSPDDAVA